MDLNYGMNIPGSIGYAGMPQQAFNYQQPQGGKTAGPNPGDLKGPLSQMAFGVMQQKLAQANRPMPLGAPPQMPPAARMPVSLSLYQPSPIGMRGNGGY